MTTFATKRTSGTLLFFVALVSTVPVLLLVLRAAAAVWRFPDLLPSAVGASATPSGVQSSTFGSFVHVLSSPELVHAMLASLGLAVATGVVGTILGFLAGRTLVGARTGVRRIATGVAFFPVIAPPIALGVGVQVLAIRAQLAGEFTGVLLAHVIPAAGYLTLFFLGVLSAYDRSMEDEARTLGATAWQTFVRVTVPALRARWGEALVLGALVSWGQLALTLLIGGGVVRTLPVALLSFVRAGDDRLAAAAAILLTAPPLLAFALLQRATRVTGASA